MKKLFFILFFSLALFSNLVFAGYRPPFGGEYTNLCGSGFDATFYSCPASCNIDNGSCSTTEGGQTIFVFICDGRQGECRQNERKIGSGTARVLDFASVGSNKTVQIDVFRKDCRNGSGWSCDGSDLLGYIVWYSGTSGGGGGGGRPQCNYSEVSLSINPNPARINQTIQFRVNGNASTWFRDEISGGVSNCAPSGIEAAWGFSCRAVSRGTFTWTRIWRNCVGSFDNCSDECRLSKNFTIQANLPVVRTIPVVDTL